MPNELPLDDLVGTMGVPPEPIVDGFPLEAFPNRFREIVARMIELNPNLPPDYLKAAMFSAGATAIGGNLRAAEGKEKLIFWFILLGYPGDGKSACLRIAFGPFDKIAIEQGKQYDAEMKLYNPEGSAAKPFKRMPFHTKPTIESLADELEHNRKGTILINEELSGWVENFSRNGKGNDEGWYNTSWDGKPLAESTRHGRKFFCPDPCLNILGGIQYGVLEAIMNRTRLSNGFFERCLFVTNDAKLLPREAVTNDQPELEAEYEELIQNLYNDSDDQNGKEALTNSDNIHLTPEAVKYWSEWCKTNCELRNRLKADGELTLMGVAAKWEKYLIRFALAVEGMRSYVKNRRKPTTIGIDALKVADQIRSYYFGNTERIVRMIERPSHLRGSTEWQVTIHNELPEEFSFGDAVAISTPLLRATDPKLTDDAIKQRLKRFLMKEYLFTHLSRDKYRKRF